MRGLLRTAFAAAIGAGVAALCWLAYAGRTGQPLGETDTTVVACAELGQAVLADLDLALAQRARQERDDYTRGRAYGRLAAGMLICFPDALTDRTRRPLRLLDVLTDPRLTVPQLQWLRTVIEQGWQRSVPGQPWRGGVL